MMAIVADVWQTLPLLIGRAHCGHHGGCSAVGADHSVDLTRTLCANPTSSYIVQVAGDSMLNVGITDGAFVVVDLGLEPESGDIVLVSMDDELMCKRLVVRGGQTYLLSENPAYDAISISEHSNVIVLGCVVSGFSLFKRNIVTT